MMREKFKIQEKEKYNKEINIRYVDKIGQLFN